MKNKAWNIFHLMFTYVDPWTWSQHVSSLCPYFFIFLLIQMNPNMWAVLPERVLTFLGSDRVEVSGWEASSERPVEPLVPPLLVLHRLLVQRHRLLQGLVWKRRPGLAEQFWSRTSWYLSSRAEGGSAGGSGRSSSGTSFSPGGRQPVYFLSQD